MSDLCLKNGCSLLKGHERSCDPFTTKPLENLPEEILKKIDKTAMTRGAQPPERVPYQNRVRRWGKAVVPFRFYTSKPSRGFENGYVIMVRPEEYFDSTTRQKKTNFPRDVIVGDNAFIYYDNRVDWNSYPPSRYRWKPRKITSGGRRKLGSSERGHYLARVPATTAINEGRDIVQGNAQGIRFFEYCSRHETWKSMMQLGYLAWKTEGIEKHATGKMTENFTSILNHYKLNDDSLLEKLRVMKDGITCCPLCRKNIQATELMERVEQAPGREVVDLTITEANLFHLADLRPGEYNHESYKLGWGHHHCNAVARDIGIEKTLKWMEDILIREGRVRSIS